MFMYMYILCVAHAVVSYFAVITAHPFSSGVDDDRSRSEDEDSVETKISNSDDDRVGARKDLA